MAKSYNEKIWSQRQDMLFLQKNKQKTFLKRHIETGKSLVYVATFYLAFTTLFIEGYQIPSGSMEPTLHGSHRGGDRIFAIKAIYKLWDLKRGDIIIFISPQDQKTRLVKRLIGFPGDTIQIERGKVLINGKPFHHPAIDKINYCNVDPPPPHRKYYGIRGQQFQVPQDYYYALGDNSESSNDSRYWGFIHQSAIIGKAVAIYWPISRIKIFD